MSEIILAELETIVTPKFMASDAELSAALGPDLSVPISLLLGNRNLRDLLAIYPNPPEALLAAARLSDKISVDCRGERIRPRVHVPRTTVVVRDMAAAHLHELLEEISDHNLWVSQQAANMWYVRCSSETEARNLAVELQRRKIRASVKNEALVKSVFVEAAPETQPGFTRLVKRYSLDDFSGVSGRPIERLIADERIRHLLTDHLHVLKP